MRYLISIASIAFMSFAQNGSTAAAGSWSAEFKGQPLVRLELRADAGKLSGTLSIADLHVDSHGAVDEAGELPADATPIFNVSQEGTTVTFSRADGDDTDRFEFHVLDSTHGELRFLLSDAHRADLAADGIPAPKPIPLRRQTTK